jgi:hypothetical protein
VVFTTVISNDFIMPIKWSVHQNEIILELKILAALKNSADVLIKIFGHVVFFIFVIKFMPKKRKWAFPAPFMYIIMLFSKKDYIDLKFTSNS